MLATYLGEVVASPDPGKSPVAKRGFLFFFVFTLDARKPNKNQADSRVAEFRLAG